MKTLEQAIAAYDEKVILGSMNLYRSLTLSGYTIQDLEDRNKARVVEQQRLQIEGDKLMKEQRLQAEKDKAAYERIAPRCPDCGLSLMLRSINTPQGKGNKYGYKSLLYCSECLYEKYSRKPADYLYQQMIENSKKEKTNG